MNNYKNPSVVLLPNPVGIDKAIQDIQNKLSSLNWIEKIYGRAFLEKERKFPNEADNHITDFDGNRPREIIYPMIYGINQEPLNVMPNDLLKSQLFFLLNDPQSYPQYEAMVDTGQVQTNVSMIFWGNLKKINPAKNYRFTEELKLEMINLLLLKCPSFIINEIFEEHDEVFSGMTLLETYRQYLKFPFTGFKISGQLNYYSPHNKC